MAKKKAKAKPLKKSAKKPARKKVSSSNAGTISFMIPEHLLDGDASDGICRSAETKRARALANQAKISKAVATGEYETITLDLLPLPDQSRDPLFQQRIVSRTLPSAEPMSNEFNQQLIRDAAEGKIPAGITMGDYPLDADSTYCRTFDEVRRNLSDNDRQALYARGGMTLVNDTIKLATDKILGLHTEKKACTKEARTKQATSRSKNSKKPSRTSRTPRTRQLTKALNKPLLDKAAKLKS